MNRQARRQGRRGVLDGDDSAVLGDGRDHGLAVVLQAHVGGRPRGLAVTVHDGHGGCRAHALSIRSRADLGVGTGRIGREVHSGAEELARDRGQFASTRGVAFFTPSDLTVVAAAALFVNEADEVLLAGGQCDGLRSPGAVGLGEEVAAARLLSDLGQVGLLVVGADEELRGVIRVDEEAVAAALGGGQETFHRRAVVFVRVAGQGVPAVEREDRLDVVRRSGPAGVLIEVVHRGAGDGAPERELQDAVLDVNE